MTYKQLVLLRYVIDKVKEGKKPSISNNEKVDLDYLENYFNNLLADVEKQKVKSKDKVLYYKVGIEISK